MYNISNNSKMLKKQQYFIQKTGSVHVLLNINFPSHYNLEQAIIVILLQTTTIFRLGLLVFLVTFSYDATPGLFTEEKP